MAKSRARGSKSSKSSTKSSGFNPKTMLVLMVAFVAIGSAAVGMSQAKGKPPRGGSYTGSLNLVMYSDTNSNGKPNWGEQIKFNVTTNAPQPYVDLNCYQNGTKVFEQLVGYYAGYPWTQIFTLKSGAWTSGAADCKADLTSGGSTVTSLSFHVDA